MQFGGDVNVVYHSDEDRTHLETVLTAVVAWRRGRATISGWRARLRRWQFRLGLGPLQRRFSIGRDAGLWYGSVGIYGEQATLFHPIRRVVRALGREYLLAPRGMTLVLLIDETTVASGARHTDSGPEMRANGRTARSRSWADPARRTHAGNGNLACGSFDAPRDRRVYRRQHLPSIGRRGAQLAPLRRRSNER